MSGSWDKTVRVWDNNGYELMISIHEQLKFYPSNLSNPLVPSYRANAIRSCHICFSSTSSHALCDTEQLLSGLLQKDGMPCAQPVKLHDDGWIRGPKGELLLWIPMVVRHPFYSMWATTVIPRGCCIELDLSQMVHGNKWHQCYKPIAKLACSS
ncbi:hypothetical protein M404DRAFT_504040 [Pisolithus tinctorius Marx 270]|uniref:Uncharacterized protein n=1 Tax=Pisolithus tinctorius Marx 270 TaxID=870435 RepID=A0A0C3PDD7_PISTI|nr:hypothetical protein M404DRAFT_504040 [Pisolithus tinctorius Marx 270]